LIAAEISAFTRYYDHVVQPSRENGDTGLLLELIEAPEKTAGEFDARGERERRTAVLLNATFNHSFDIQRLLQEMKPALSRTSRIVAVTFNSYFALLYRLGHRLGLKAGDDPTTFITYQALGHIAKLAGFEVVRTRNTVYLPFRLLGLGDLINALLPAIPLIRHLAFVTIVVLRPVIEDEERPSISIIVPARNECGNIAAVLRRLPDLGTRREIVFVEGGSTDGTWEEIQRIAAEHPDSVRALQQTGRGKNDAVRLGIMKATGDLVTIVDADLSMPPELLSAFYDAYRRGLADFVNGSRLVYPMEGEAMRFLNRLGNIFFTKALRFVLDTPITDVLCGTKLVARHDLTRFRRWREDFGDFDPFGDFELLYPAAVLALGTIDLPIRYRARTYGTTNIHRFRDGFRLLRMTAVALARIRTGRLP
jgi:hypothetical protein